MKKKIFWLVGILILIGAGYACSNFMEVDQCLDNGGCWDYSAKVCRKAEPNAQELCDKSVGR